MNNFYPGLRQSIGFRFFIYCFLFLGGAILSALTSMVIMNQENTDSVRIAQGISSTFLFIIPPIVLYAITRKKPFIALGFRKSNNILCLLAGIVILFVALPLIGTLTAWNESLDFGQAFPKIEAWMRGMQDRSDAITKKMLTVSTFDGLLLNLIVIALIPAIGEELTFRSVIQQFLVKKCRNVHVALFITAVIFSAIHMQFYGFFPRLLLGLFLGYFFYATGSIWTSIIMHFINNGSAVLMYYMVAKSGGDLDIDVETMGHSVHPAVLITSAIITFLIMYFAWRHRVKTELM